MRTFRDERGQDALIALSIANLHFLAPWSALLATENLLFRATITADAVAITLCVLGLGALLFTAIRLVRRLRTRAAPVVHLFVLALIVPIDWLRLEIPALTRGFWLESYGWTGNVAWMAVVLAIAACAAVLYLRDPARVRRGIRWGALVLAPLLPICLAQALYYERWLASPPTAPAIPHTVQRPRLLWLLFDEMDFPIAFVNRPIGFSLPNFDRLRRESLFATNARSPSRDTQLSVPSLLGGRPVVRFVPLSANDAILGYAPSASDGSLRREGESSRWRSTQTVFDQVRAQRLNAGVAGASLLPFCRLFSEQLTKCDNGPASRTVREMVIYTLLTHPVLLRDYFGSSQAVAELRVKLLRRAFAADHFKALDATRRLARDPSLDYVFAHFALPHPPWVAGRPPSYYGNLALADSLFGVLRRSMEESGAWDETTVIVTSDHGLRPRRAVSTPIEQAQLRHPGDSLAHSEPTHVPLFVKLAGKADSLTYARPFATVLLSELTMKLLRRELTTAENVAAWMESATQGAFAEQSVRRPR